MRQLYRAAPTDACPIAHCCGVFVLPKDDSIAVVFSWQPPTNQWNWLKSEIVAKAKELLAAAERDNAHRQAEQQARLQREKETLRRNPRYSDLADVENKFGRMRETDIPRLVVDEQLLALMPTAATFTPSSETPKTLQREAMAVVAASGLEPSRDGIYDGILFGYPKRTSGALISWKPHTGLPPYPEIRWALSRRLAAALRRPRHHEPDRPVFGGGEIDITASESREALGTREINLDDANGGADARKALKERSLEAIGWYQPFHAWTEASWGILSGCPDARRARVQFA